MLTDQTPISSPFNAHSTAHDVVNKLDLTGKTAIVTGGYSGLGLETVRALSGAGATVIVPARDTEKASRAVEGMDGVEVIGMDLTEAASIETFASGFLARNIPLPIMINSAGVMATPLFRDGDGHEGQFATNHLGHFRLVKALWPALVKARGARVVSVSSRGHQIAGVEFDDIDFQRRGYDRWVAYGNPRRPTSSLRSSSTGADRQTACVHSPCIPARSLRTSHATCQTRISLASTLSTPTESR